MTRSRKPKKRPPLPIGQCPTLIVADGDGTELRVAHLAAARGWPVLGYVPRGRSGSARRPGTFSEHPLQAVKWNTRAADLTIVLTADATLHGRARWAALWAARYRKPWLHWWPGVADDARLRTWLRTYRWRSLQITGAAEHQLGPAAALIEPLLASISGQAYGRVTSSPTTDHNDGYQTEKPH